MNELYAEMQNVANIVAAPNWADKLSALAAIIAVIVAVIVALRQNKILEQQNEIAIKQAEIAEQQNKIALFEKKYELYCNIKNVIFFSRSLSVPSEKLEQKTVFKFFQNNFQIRLELNEINENLFKMESLISNIRKDLGMIYFLFSEDVSKHYTDIDTILLQLSEWLKTYDDFYLDEIYKHLKKISLDDIIKKMEQEVQI